MHRITHGSDKADKAAAKKERTPGKHSRNGCGTCKKRRVKCDEEKPTCRRCRNFGVGCDGYEPPPQPKCAKSTAAATALLPPRKILRKEPSCTDMTLTPSTVVCESDVEQRFFLSFRDHTVCGMKAHLDSQTWRRMLLQASAEPAIRHAVIALGALEEWSMTTHDDQAMAAKNVRLEANKLHQTALQHYNRSINIMVKMIAGPKMETRTRSLLSLVIICFESLQRNYALASPHVYASLALLKNAKLSGSSTIASPSNSSEDEIEHDLARIFGRLEIQSMCFVDPRPTETHKHMISEGADRVRNMPPVFGSLDEAKDYMEIFVRRAQRLIHLAEALSGHGGSDGTMSPPDRYEVFEPALEPVYSLQGTTPPGEGDGSLPSAPVLGNSPDFYTQQPTPPKTPSVPGTTSGSSSPSPPPPVRDLCHHQCVHIHDISLWKLAFDAFLHQCPSELNNPDTTLLSIYYLVVYVATNLVNPTPPTPIFPSPPPHFANEMAAIVSLSAQLLPTLQSSQAFLPSSIPIHFPSSPTSPTTTSGFTFNLGVILPLYFVGIQCRSNAIRQRAIDLLLHAPSYGEGVNSAVLAGKIAQWVMEIENEWVDERGEVPRWAKANHLTVVFYPDDKKRAKIKCVQGRVGDGSLGSGVVKRETVVTW